MSTNHNRIKVADLEINEPNKTLITNENGELEFSNITGGSSQDLQSVIENGSFATLSSGGKVRFEDPDTFNKTEISGDRIKITIDDNGDNVTLNPNALSFSKSDNYVLYNRDGIKYTNDDGGLVQLEFGDIIQDNNITLKIPSNLTTGTYTLATLEDINDNFIHKTGEVTESIDGYKLFRSTIQIRGVDDEVSTSVSSRGIIYSENGYPSLTLSPNHLGGGEGTNSLVEIPRKSGTLVLSVNGEVADESGNVVIGGSNVDASATTAGSINNTSLQELGGVDKLINGVRVGKGAGIGIENTALGFETLQSNTGDYNTGVGYNALKSNTSGISNLAIGSSSLASNTAGNHNSGVGTYSLYTNTTGEYNTGVGNNAMYSNTTGSKNVATGAYSMVYNTTGTDNTAVGSTSLYSNTTGGKNTGVGSGSFYYTTTGSNNVAIGYAAGMRINGQGNTALGDHAYGGSSVTPSTGNKNITIGFQAGRDITSGSNNILLENIINQSITSGNNNIILNPRNKAGISTGSGNTIIGGFDGAFGGADSELVVLASGTGKVAIRKNTNDELIAPNLTNALISSGGNKSLLTLEYLNSKIGTTAPTSATATGTVGEIRVTPGYIYWCTAPNTWIRAAGSTF